MTEPNFERLKFIFEGSKRFEITISDMQELWEFFKTSDFGVYTDPLTESQLFDLLKEYEMEYMYHDFRFMGIEFHRWVKFEKASNDSDELGGKINMELAQALSYFFTEKNDLKIVIKSTKKQESTSIQTSQLIKIIREGLFEYYKKIYPSEFIKEDKIVPFNFPDRAEHFKLLIKELSVKSSKKGRKKDNLQIAKIVYCLIQYLQNYSELKSESSTKYTNAQARFIYRFCEIHKLITNAGLLSRREDIVGYYFKDFHKIKDRIQLMI